MILAGIDEAGYGPTLGPLVVSASAFRIPDEACPEGVPACLWTLLEKAVCRKPDGSRVAVNDSKKLFHQKKGLRDLEEGLLPFLCLREPGLPRDLRALLRAAAGRGSGQPSSSREVPDSYLDAYPWYQGQNLDLPVDTYAGFVKSRAAQLRSALESAGVKFLGLAARPFEVLEFNREVDARQNKAEVSFIAVEGFLRRFWRRFPTENVEVVVDRQGGRMRYGAILYEKIRPRGIRVELQTPEVSTYCLVRRAARGKTGAQSPAPGEFRVTFAVDSESECLPVALASMLSKYVRETHMILFNKYWKGLRGDLKPTAGYATDARRFLGDIAPLRERLGVSDSLLVRNR
jgi:hypothetical protein